MCVCMCSVMSNSATPWAVVRQAPLSPEFSRQEHCNALPFPPPGDLPDPGIEPTALALEVALLLSHHGTRRLFLTLLFFILYDSDFSPLRVAVLETLLFCCLVNFPWLIPRAQFMVYRNWMTIICQISKIHRKCLCYFLSLNMVDTFLYS